MTRRAGVSTQESKEVEEKTGEAKDERPETRKFTTENPEKTVEDEERD
jgi:hypothetical protein